MSDDDLLKSLVHSRQREAQAFAARVDYLLERLIHIRQQESQAFAARERLAASLRPARQPRQLRFSSALRRLGAWCLGLLLVSRRPHYDTERR